MRRRALAVVISVVVSVLPGALCVRAQGGPPPPSPEVAAARAALGRETAEDYADMQRQLGIQSMRPGPSGNPSAADAANTNEATAMPFTDLPDPLRMRDGTPVTTRRAWARRRVELLDMVAGEVYGHVPRDVPPVRWREVRRMSTMVGGRCGGGSSSDTWTPADVARPPLDLPVDGHTLIALCAPRKVFISHGIPERGDAHWIDQRGGWMAALAAQPVFRLLGVRDLGVTEPWQTAPMPPVNSGLLDGALAWRQHDGGHTDQPNWTSFIAWATAAPR